VFRRWVMLVLWCAALFASTLPAAADGPTVWVVELEGEVNSGQAAYLARALRAAEAAGAVGVVLEISSTGGTLEAALSMYDRITSTALPTVAWVRDRAWSAAALVALAAERLYMAPGSSMGAAEPRPAEEKYVSAMRAAMAAAAEQRGRDPEVARAMVDAAVTIPGLVEAGKILTLTAAQAQEIGFSDGTAPDLAVLLARLGWRDLPLMRTRQTWAERAAGLVTHPLVAPLLLSLGLVAAITELITPGWGVAGLLALTCFGLFFGGHLLAGFAGWESVLLFAAGLGLLAAEAAAPGFGLFGLSGIVALAVAIYMASASGVQAVRTLAVGLVSAGAASVVLLRVAARRGWLLRFTLRTALTSKKGYVARPSTADLLGRKGIAVTPLRPAGVALIGDRRVDVVTEGSFLEAGTRVKVVKVEGPRIVVESTE